MGLFGRRNPRPASTDAGPPARGECACPEHIEELLDLAVPMSREMSEELDEPMTVGELIECSALGVELVAWEDREVIHVGAPTLCEDGVLAAAARALIDPRVRLPED